MNILSLRFFKLLRLRSSKLKTILAAHDAAKKELDELDQGWGGVDISSYTVVDRTPGGRKCDLLTSVHMGSRQLDSAKKSQKTGKAHWHHHTNEQQYRPRQIKIDKQLEYIWDELGLSKEMEQTIIGPSNPIP